MQIDKKPQRLLLMQRVLSDLVDDAPAACLAVQPYCRACDFQSGEYLLRAGEVATEVFFLCDGLVRFFYLQDDGKEHNKSFAEQTQFAGALQAEFSPQPSRFYVQALEPVSALALSLDGLHTLYNESLDWANLGRRYMQTVVLRKSAREASFLLDSAEQRYLDFQQQYPGLAERLPLYHIASYLGITDVALSRIRRRLREPKR